MYFFEWMFWWGSALDEEEKAKTFGKGFVEERQRDFKELLEEEPIALDQSASDSPRTRGPVYGFNDTFLEMRSGSLEHYRGLLTPLALAVIFLLGGVLGYVFISEILKLLKLVASEYVTLYLFMVRVISLLIFGSFFLVPWYFIFKLKLYIPVRWELFTQRRLLIRFNRKARQVYLHRPGYAGGVMTLSWDDVYAAPEGAGMPLLLGWFPHQTGQPFMAFAAVGKRAGSAQELLDEWEFIRRYMEEGPESVPKPRVRSKIPWPWYSLEPQFEGLWPILRHGGWKMWLGKILISPAFLTLGAGHWVSQLLCWEPRWPKIIREAGQPGKPTPTLTTAEDYDPETCRRLYLNADLWVPSKEDDAILININHADAKTLAGLEGIGMGRAKEIVAYREQHGDFELLEHLQRVPGVGQDLVRRNRWRMTTILGQAIAKE